MVCTNFKESREIQRSQVLIVSFAAVIAEEEALKLEAKHAVQTFRSVGMQWPIACVQLENQDLNSEIWILDLK